MDEDVCQGTSYLRAAALPTEVGAVLRALAPEYTQCRGGAQYMGVVSQ